MLCFSAEIEDLKVSENRIAGIYPKASLRLNLILRRTGTHRAAALCHIGEGGECGRTESRQKDDRGRLKPTDSDSLSASSLLVDWPPWNRAFGGGT